MNGRFPPGSDGRRPYRESIGRRGGLKFFTVLVILMGLILLMMSLNSYLLERKANVSKAQVESQTNGNSLGGAMGGGDDSDMPTPESLAREMKGGGMKVLISSPSGDKVINLKGTRGVSVPSGGDTTKAVPVGGAGAGSGE